MASIHIKEIQSLLSQQGASDAKPHSPGGYFLEIRFDDPEHRVTVPDEEFRNKAIRAESSYGSVLITFDEMGRLKSMEFS